jgi:hypothetical protein
MKPQAMVNSVTKDRIPLWNLSKLSGVWIESERLPERLKAAGFKSDTGSLISFDFIREEIKRHLVGSTDGKCTCLKIKLAKRAERGTRSMRQKKGGLRHPFFIDDHFAPSALNLGLFRNRILWN